MVKNFSVWKKAVGDRNTYFNKFSSTLTQDLQKYAILSKKIANLNLSKDTVKFSQT
jgi:hypothetical protein